MDKTTKMKDEVVFSFENATARVSVVKGGALTSLHLAGREVIRDFSEEIPYELSYASAVLFPFANRIVDGRYTFDNRELYLKKNSINQSDAIHGLLYDKTFCVESLVTGTANTRLVLRYEQHTKLAGFPFAFEVRLTYTLFSDRLVLAVEVMNTDEVSFPFSIGWHPYFTSDNRALSILEIDADKEVVHDDNMVPIAIAENSLPKRILISEQRFDHCFVMNAPEVKYTTPSHTLEVSSSYPNSYFQVYTPEKSNNIAIEPVTAPANSFNNHIGLQTLAPDEVFHIQWQIRVKDE